MKRTFAIISALVLMACFSAHGATDDQTVDGKTRKAIHQKTQDYIAENTVGGTYRFYDVVTNEVVRLKFKKLHGGIRTTDDFFMSCADFENEDGVLFDMDFLLIQNEDGQFVVTQPYLHAIEKQHRPFHP